MKQMHYITLALPYIATGVGIWQNNFYAFMFGCAWVVATTVHLAADKIVREIRDARASVQPARPIFVSESPSAQATAREVTRLMKMQGGA